MTRAIRDNDTAAIQASLALSSEHPVATTQDIDVNDQMWNLLYKSIVNGIGANPSNFQLVYPFTSWNWPVSTLGFTSAAEYDFVSSVPQFSAIGRYTSGGSSFNDDYQQMLNVVAKATTDPQLKAQIENAQNSLTIATNNYQLIFNQAQLTYNSDTGGSNDPTFQVWLTSAAGFAFKARLDTAINTVTSAQNVLNQLTSETTTPGLEAAVSRFNNEEFYTKFSDNSLSSFPKVPAYSTSTDPTTWLTNVLAGTAGSEGSISFDSSESTYDYSKTWAGGSASVGNFFWAVNVGGSWKEINEFSSDKSLSVTINFKAWDQISIQAGRWFNGAFVRSVQNGPFVRNFSPYGTDAGTKAVWGKNGIMSTQKVGMLVCYKPSFKITVSAASFESFYESWNVSSGLRIGPFQFGGGGGSTSSGWKADKETRTFTGTTSSDNALIFGVNINEINPKGS